MLSTLQREPNVFARFSELHAVNGNGGKPKVRFSVVSLGHEAQPRERQETLLIIPIDFLSLMFRRSSRASSWPIPIAAQMLLSR